MAIEKPGNLVFLFTDQQRQDTMAVYGNSKIKTPVLNRLAEEGVLFKRAYVAQPVCTPSRATIVTGLYPHTHRLITNNLILSDEFPTIADMTKKSGYQTAYMGKWHVGNEVIPQHGFDTWVSTEDGFYRAHFGKEEYKSINCTYYHFLKDNGFKPDLEDGDYTYFTRDFATRIPVEYSKPAFTAAEADKYIRENRDRPFVLFVNFLEPHPPYYSAYDDMYSPDELDLPPNFGRDPAPDTPLKYTLNRYRAKYEGRHFPLKDEAAWRKQMARYWGQISLVDRYVGEILNSLKNHGVEDRTTVVYTSDHGDMMGDFGMLAKGVMLEPAVKVPMLIKVPGEADRQRIIEEPVGHIDLVPTLLDVLGLPPYGEAQGKSLYPEIRGDRPLKGNDVFIEYSSGAFKKDNKFAQTAEHLMQSGDPDVKKRIAEISDRASSTYSGRVEDRTVVSSDCFKLNLTEAGENELYDLNSDPLELNNLYSDKEYAGKIEELRGKIKAWQKETGDKAEI